MNVISRTRMLNEAFKRFQRLPTWPLDNAKPASNSPLVEDDARIIELRMPVREVREDARPEPVPVRQFQDIEMS